MDLYSVKRYIPLYRVFYIYILYILYIYLGEVAFPKSTLIGGRIGRASLVTQRYIR